MSAGKFHPLLYKVEHFQLSTFFHIGTSHMLPADMLYFSFMLFFGNLHKVIVKAKLKRLYNSFFVVRSGAVGKVSVGQA